MNLLELIRHQCQLTYQKYQLVHTLIFTSGQNMSALQQMIILVTQLNLHGVQLVEELMDLFIRMHGQLIISHSTPAQVETMS